MPETLAGLPGTAHCEAGRLPILQPKPRTLNPNYPKAPKRVLGLLGEGFGFGGEGLGPHYKGPGSLGYSSGTT